MLVDSLLPRRWIWKPPPKMLCRSGSLDLTTTAANEGLHNLLRSGCWSWPLARDYVVPLCHRRATVTRSSVPPCASYSLSSPSPERNEQSKRVRYILTIMPMEQVLGHYEKDTHVCLLHFHLIHPSVFIR